MEKEIGERKKPGRDTRAISRESETCGRKKPRLMEEIETRGDRDTCNT